MGLPYIFRTVSTFITSKFNTKFYNIATISIPAPSNTPPASFALAPAVDVNTTDDVFVVTVGGADVSIVITGPALTPVAGAVTVELLLPTYPPRGAEAEPGKGELVGGTAEPEPTGLLPLSGVGYGTLEYVADGRGTRPVPVP